MNASKETARKANSFAFDLMSDMSNESREMRVSYIRQFLDAAERKLPTEAAYKRDRERRKK